MSAPLISRRKSEHLRIVAEEEVLHSTSTLLDDVQLIHQSLPELDCEDLELGQTFFGKQLRAPLMIASMTGGAEFAERLNHDLAALANELGIAFAVGSQRVMVRHPETVSHFNVRSLIPDGILLGNIGGVQLLELDLDTVAGLVEQIDADGICVHLNPAQELMQVEGNRRFKGVLDGIARLMDRLDGRVLVKETGAGLSPEALRRLRSIGVKAVDVSGTGGTSWTKVESFRASNDPLRKTGELFGNWGVPTAFSVAAAAHVLEKETTIIASGGIENGLDAARSIALGANVAGVARAVLIPYLEGGISAARTMMLRMIEDLKVAMLLTGSKNLATLQSAPRVIRGELREWFAAYGWMVGESVE